MKTTQTDSTHNGAGAIAVIGMGCRFPGGVASPDDFWQLLKNGTDAVTEVPPERWSNREFHHPDRERPGKTVARHGGFLPRVDHFDPQFFGISPGEATYMDPQQRLLLEVVWEALEDGAQAPKRLAGANVGVFMGAFALDYQAIQFDDYHRRHVSPYMAAGGMATMISNRISYIYDFRGPSLTIDTACSSALVAVHMACESLRRGESCLALAGGVNVILSPHYSILESQAGFLSPSGRCKAFDAAADGYVRGEGVGVVVLKPLAAALADGDPVQAVILASGVNQDGHSLSITQPSQQSQERLIESTLAAAGLLPRQVQYVEAHGTGTQVGDPVEASALGAAYSKGRPALEPLVIGSGKTNIGHTEAAAGAAGLIKTVLCLKHKQIPPHLHFQQPNPAIAFTDLKLRIPVHLEPWPAHTGAAVAAVNSFGYGGTNAHVVVREAPVQPLVKNFVPPPYILPLSARHAEGVSELAAACSERLAGPEAPALVDFCRSSAVRREHHGHRLAVCAKSGGELRQLLELAASGESAPGIVRGSQPSTGAPGLVWVFSGMGPQWPGMGRELLSQEPVFRQALERCDAYFRPLAGWSLVEELARTGAESRMEETDVAMSMNFALQVALSALWRSWGIVPAAIVGHSAGEVAAFYEAGVHSLADAVTIAYQRSRLLHRLSGVGKMAAVGVSEAVAAGFLQQHGLTKVEIAAVNSPASVTLSGDSEELEWAISRMAERNYFCRLLRVAVPFHSAYTDAIRQELVASLGSVTARPPATPLYSTVTGQPLEVMESPADYWWQNVRRQVRFEPAVRELISRGDTNFLEIGPHPVLSGALAECLRAGAGQVIASLRRGTDGRRALFESLAELYAMGIDPDWEALYPTGQWTPLPAYPWRRQVYWHEAQTARQTRLGVRVHPLLGSQVDGAASAWEAEISLFQFPYLADHRVLENNVFPMAGYVEAVAAALKAHLGAGHFAIEQLRLLKSLNLSDQSSLLLQVGLDLENGRFKVGAALSVEDRQFREFACGRLRQLQPVQRPGSTDLAEARRRCPRVIGQAEAYGLLRAMGYDYGPRFQGVQGVFLGRDEALAEVTAPSGIAGDSDYLFHPALMDACFQALLAAEFPAEDAAPDAPPSGADGEFRIPVGIDQVRFYRQPGKRMLAHGRLTGRTESVTRGDLRVYDEDGQLVAEFLGFTKQAVDAGSSRLSQEQLESRCYGLEWQPLVDVGAAAVPDARGALLPDLAADQVEWLLLADGTGLADEVAARLRTRGSACTVVIPAREYSFTAHGLCQLSPGNGAHYAQLLRDLAAAGGGRELRAVHCWNLDLPAPEAVAASEWEDPSLWQRVNELGCYSLVSLAQAAAESAMPMRIWLVTQGAQTVTGDQPACSVFQSAAWGLARSLGQQECRQLWGGAIDLEPRTPAAEAASALLAELAADDAEDQVALRNHVRYGLRITRAARLTGSLPAQLREDGTYVVTGAFGALGREICRWLVRSGGRRLLLISRSGASGRGELVQELEAAGARVRVARADVTDGQAVDALVRELQALAWPPIRGLIHCAGVLCDRLLAGMDRESFDAAFDPKVKGAWALHRAFSDQPLEFFILFSSLAAVLPAAGQANYAAGNAFLDGLAAYRRSLGLPALSIDWGPWSSGMVERSQLVEFYRSSGMDCITPGQGLQLLEHVLGQNVAQTILLSAEWRTVLRLYPWQLPLLALLEQQVEEEIEDPDSGLQILDRLRSLDVPERRAAVRDHFVGLVAELLRFQRPLLDTGKSLPAVGLDSLAAMKLRTRVLNDLGVGVMVADLLSGVPIDTVADRVASQFEAVAT